MPTIQLTQREAKWFEEIKRQLPEYKDFTAPEDFNFDEIDHVCTALIGLHWNVEEGATGRRIFLS